MSGRIAGHQLDEIALRMVLCEQVALERCLTIRLAALFGDDPHSLDQPLGFLVVLIAACLHQPGHMTLMYLQGLARMAFFTRLCEFLQTIDGAFSRGRESPCLVEAALAGKNGYDKIVIILQARPARIGFSRLD